MRDDGRKDGTTYETRRKYPTLGKCIYCGISAAGARLTTEHIVPFSLDGNDEIEKACCDECAKPIKAIEQHVARDVFGKYRALTNTQTRRPRDRPKVFDSNVRFRGKIFTFRDPIKDHPFELFLPVFPAPQILRGAKKSEDFGWCDFPVFRYGPDLTERLKARPGERWDIITYTRLNPHKLARVMAKVAYCQAVARLGIDGVDWHPYLIDIILGKNPNVPFLVGSPLGFPWPFDPLEMEWRINLEMVATHDGSIYKVGIVRVFTYGGTQQGMGFPFYMVVLGHPLESNALNNADFSTSKPSTH